MMAVPTLQLQHFNTVKTQVDMLRSNLKGGDSEPVGFSPLLLAAKNLASLYTADLTELGKSIFVESMADLLNRCEFCATSENVLDDTKNKMVFKKNEHVSVEEQLSLLEKATDLMRGAFDLQLQRNQVNDKSSPKNMPPPSPSKDPKTPLSNSTTSGYSKLDLEPSSSKTSFSEPKPEASTLPTPEKSAEYKFDPPLQLERSGSLGFRAALRPLIQKLPFALGVPDVTGIVDDKPWLPLIVEALSDSAAAGETAVNHEEVKGFIDQKEINEAEEKIKNISSLSEAFQQDNVGQKLSELLDDTKLLREMCLARIAVSNVKPSSLGAIQNNPKGEASDLKLKNPSSWRNKVLEKWEGPADKRRQNHKLIFDEVTKKVKTHLLGRREIQTMLQEECQTILQKHNGSLTAEMCQELFKFALKCYAAGAYSDQQLNVGNTNATEGSGAFLLVQLLKAQRFLQRQPEVYTDPRSGVSRYRTKNGELVYRKPNLEECKAVLTALGTGFGVPFALDVSDGQTTVNFEPGHVLLSTKLQKEVLSPLVGSLKINLELEENKNIQSFLSFISKRVHSGFEVFNITANNKAKAEAGSSSNPQARVGQYFETQELKPMIDSIVTGQSDEVVKERLTTMSALFGKLKTTEPQKPIISNQDCLWQMLTKVPVTWGHLIDWVNDSSGSNSEDFQKKLEALSQIVVIAGSQDSELKQLLACTTLEKVKKYANSELAIIEALKGLNDFSDSEISGNYDNETSSTTPSVELKESDSVFVQVCRDVFIQRLNSQGFDSSKLTAPQKKLYMNVITSITKKLQTNFEYKENEETSSLEKRFDEHLNNFRGIIDYPSERPSVDLQSWFNQVLTKLGSDGDSSGPSLNNTPVHSPFGSRNNSTSSLDSVFKVDLTTQPELTPPLALGNHH